MCFQFCLQLQDVYIDQVQCTKINSKQKTLKGSIICQVLCVSFSSVFYTCKRCVKICKTAWECSRFSEAVISNTYFLSCNKSQRWCFSFWTLGGSSTQHMTTPLLFNYMYTLYSESILKQKYHYNNAKIHLYK